MAHPLWPGFARPIRTVAAGLFIGLVPAAGDAFMVALDPVAAMLVLDILLKAAILALVAALLFALAEPLLDPLAPMRRPAWLVAAAAGFALYLTALHCGFAWKTDALADLTPLRLLATLLLGAGSGLIWFALLPAHRADVAAPFD
jgi:hypothetical protein